MEEETYAAYGRPICRGNVHSRHSPPQPARALAQSGDYRSRVQISAPRSTESPAQAGFFCRNGRIRHPHSLPDRGLYAVGFL